MLYFFYDNNTGKSFVKARKLFNDLMKKKPDAVFIELDEATVTPEYIEELLESQGLFEKKIVCLLKNITKNKCIEKEVKSLVTKIAESESVFVWLETDLKKGELELFQNQATKVFLEKEIQKIKKEEINVFKIAQYFGTRDKKNGWKYFLELKARGVSAEEIHGILWWQLKSILLTFDAKTARETGLKPFVFTKAKSLANNFKKNELQQLADKLVVMYHEAHRGTCDLYDELEVFLLEL